MWRAATIPRPVARHISVGCVAKRDNGIRCVCGGCETGALGDDSCAAYRGDVGILGGGTTLRRLPARAFNPRVDLPPSPPHATLNTRYRDPHLPRWRRRRHLVSTPQSDVRTYIHCTGGGGGGKRTTLGEMK